MSCCDMAARLFCKSPFSIVGIMDLLFFTAVLWLQVTEKCLIHSEDPVLYADTLLFGKNAGLNIAADRLGLCSLIPSLEILEILPPHTKMLSYGCT